MLATLKSRRDREEGFTLIELMVVVLIIAILIAIAIPTFLGARQRAQERAAQSSVRNALTASKTLFTDNEDYDTADAAGMLGVEPSLAFIDGGLSTTPNTISIGVKDTNADGHYDQIVLAALAKNDTCWVVMDNALDPDGVGGLSPGVQYGTDVAANCDATNFDEATGPGTPATWSNNW